MLALITIAEKDRFILGFLVLQLATTILLLAGTVPLLRLWAVAPAMPPDDGSSLMSMTVHACLLAFGLIGMCWQAVMVRRLVRDMEAIRLADATQAQHM